VSVAGGLAVPALAALAAAGAFGVAAALQHQQAGLARPTRGLSPGLLADVARRPRWLAGVALATAAYGLQAVALAYGPLTLVAPIVAADLLVALPLAARWSRRPLRPRDWAGCLLVAVGVSVFLAAAPPSGERRTAPAGDWFTVLGLVAVIVLAALAISRGRLPALRLPALRRAALRLPALRRATLRRAAWPQAGSAPPGRGESDRTQPAVTPRSRADRPGPAWASPAPASTDPARTDPASTGPASTGPVSTGPASTGPARTARASVVPVGAGRARTGRGGGWFRAGALAAAAGVVFGLTAAVTASFTTALRADGLRSLLAHWQPGALIVLGLTGIFLSTAAFQAGSLASSLPVIDTVEPVSGVIIGAVLFDERLAASATGLVLQLGAATVAATGIAMLGPSLAAVQAASDPAPAGPAPAGPAPAHLAAGSAASGPYRNEGVRRSHGLGPPARTAAPGAVRARGGPTECDLLELEGPPTTTEDRADQFPL
jgi:hypothetical protein